jgi:hypothetical protein
MHLARSRAFLRHGGHTGGELDLAMSKSASPGRGAMLRTWPRKPSTQLPPDASQRRQPSTQGCKPDYP